jgi:hypothetical protein
MGVDLTAATIDSLICFFNYLSNVNLLKKRVKDVRHDTCITMINPTKHELTGDQGKRLKGLFVS